MPYWRMQLHPGDASKAMRYAVESLAAGFIGLDFGAAPGPSPAADDMGDLLKVNAASLPEGQRDYLGFATQMKEGDHVLIIVHHFPFALCRVAGGYNYIREVCPELSIWFRHFRRVDEVRYHGDLTTNVQKWEQIKMTDTISPLHDPGSKSYVLIERWRAA
jgi:hypothetical protein